VLDAFSLLLFFPVFNSLAAQSNHSKEITCQEETNAHHPIHAEALVLFYAARPFKS
jgi:hypothetical protein